MRLAVVTAGHRRDQSFFRFAAPARVRAHGHGEPRRSPARWPGHTARPPHGTSPRPRAPANKNCGHGPRTIGSVCARTRLRACAHARKRARAKHPPIKRLANALEGKDTLAASLQHVRARPRSRELETLHKTPDASCSAPPRKSSSGGNSGRIAYFRARCSNADSAPEELVGWKL